VKQNTVAIAITNL